jgi:hypothetical protein
MMSAVTGRLGLQLTLLNSTSRALARAKEAKIDSSVEVGDMVVFYEFMSRSSKQREDRLEAYF